MKAYLKNYRQAPRKVRLIADEMRGKRVTSVLDQLSFMPHKASLPLKKLVQSAVANAKQVNQSLTEEALYIERITVDKGRTIVRYMPRAFGRASPINRESSHIEIVLAEQPNVKTESEKPKTTTKSKK